MEEEARPPAEPVEPGSTELERREPEPEPAPATAGKPPRDRGIGVWTSVAIALLAAAAFLVFVAQNTEDSNVEWTVWSVGVPLAAIVFGAMLLGSVLTLAVGAIWRLRRRRRLRERQELHRLRTGG
ncbi:MAG TPA: hypothetical protein VFI37_09075 [Gaiellaceae bacterium]|jgi:uncharacterized integral membrane protein|nr:hypothetical protein [Gaiellaceae bacterium]